MKGIPVEVKSLQLSLEQEQARFTKVPLGVHQGGDVGEHPEHLRGEVECGGIGLERPRSAWSGSAVCDGQNASDPATKTKKETTSKSAK